MEVNATWDLASSSIRIVKLRVLSQRDGRMPTCDSNANAEDCGYSVKECMGMIAMHSLIQPRDVELINNVSVLSAETLKFDSKNIATVKVSRDCQACPKCSSALRAESHGTECRATLDSHGTECRATLGQGYGLARLICL